MAITETAHSTMTWKELDTVLAGWKKSPMRDDLELGLVLMGKGGHYDDGTEIEGQGYKRASLKGIIEMDGRDLILLERVVLNKAKERMGPFDAIGIFMDDKLVYYINLNRGNTYLDEGDTVALSKGVITKIEVPA